MQRSTNESRPEWRVCDPMILDVLRRSDANVRSHVCTGCCMQIYPDSQYLGTIRQVGARKELAEKAHNDRVVIRFPRFPLAHRLASTGSISY